MLGCVGRTGNHSIGIPFIDHHGSKIGNINHPVFSDIQVYIFVFPKFIIGLCIILKIWGFHGIYDLNFVEIQDNSKVSNFSFYGFCISKQGDINQIHCY